MENENLTPEVPPQMDSFEREERCRRAIKTISKAIIMRILVAVLLAWSVLRFPMETWVWGLMAFVIIVDLSALLPLGKELHKQHMLLQEILDSEE